MKARLIVAFVSFACASTAWAAAALSTLPGDSMTVTDYYKQSVYDPQENKIGTVDDVLVDKSGKVTALIIGVGGFLGAGEKDVAFAFQDIKPTKKDDKWWLTVDASKDALQSAPGYKYDRASTTWVANK
jgi:sporulation protein YlmC with PRC-barrel domain